MDTPAHSGRIAFICAMPMELKPLVRKLSLEKTQLEGATVHAGTLGGRDVVAIVTGMGTKLATEGTERLLDAVHVHHAVVVGITGAVDNETPIGSLILPEVVVDSATGKEHRPAPLGNEGTPRGKMWTGDVLLTDPDAIAELRADGVVSLDMETAAIAEACERRGIPWSVFRVISDRATDGTPNGPAIARYFVKHPARIPRMAKVARGARLATQNAAEAAIRAVASAHG
jgi:adenosylhomocysteine nucleosidase